MSNAPYVVSVELVIKPERVAQFLPLILENAAASLKHESGCLVFDVCQGTDDKAQIFLYEVYQDEAAFQHHLKTEHFLKFDRQTAPDILSKTVRIFARLQ
ncbi:putative quinol monooxygenase [Bordetella genomosp. 4]|uniref:putative quinol monooxygenase n=1 Tax=Bordetella genomosp. 4 TaxID=463044 RepID=UPI000B9EDCFE|nr:putative quinol monooxygenase [Bordetella genomosp. 4]OZI47104.1 hypothetical protein CAL21_13810 [Bordetella genomosp. 4]